MDINLENIKDKKIWIISDTHFGHDRITDYALRPGHIEKNYSEDDELLLKNWNKYVNDDDLVIHLGDVAFSETAVHDIAAACKGHVQYVRGNHDHSGRRRALAKIGWQEIEPFTLVYEDAKIHFTHFPLSKPQVSLGHANVCGHIHNNPSDTTGGRHINVGVEVFGFCPIPLIDILKRAKYVALKDPHSDMDRNERAVLESLRKNVIEL